jgi:hypothetical protein
VARFVLAFPDGSRFLAASYGPAGSGIKLTDLREDACSWVTIDKAAEVAREIAPALGRDLIIEEVAA